jgi:hypothetical protein
MVHNYNITKNEFNSSIWRYLDFSKFMNLLENSNIFFPIVDLFEDKLEGFHNALGENDYYDVTNEGQIIKIDSALDERQIENSQLFKGYSSHHVDALRKSVGVSCWRFSEHESHAMWKVFLSSNEGVAIRTTFNDISKGIKCSKENQNICIGKVNYVDFKKNKIPIDNMFNPLFHKNIHFKNEEELRILAYEVNNIDKGTFEIGNLKEMHPGITLEFDYKVIIKEIIVSPYAPEWFFDLVKKLCIDKYELDVKINWSQIGLRK